MGMWQGILAGYTSAQNRRLRREELALEREKFERALLERRRDVVLERVRNNLQEARNERESIAAGIRLGLDPVVVRALQNTGELSTILASVDPDDVTSREYLAGLNDFVMTQLVDLAEADEDSIAAAIVNGVNTDRDISDPYHAQMAAMEAVLSAGSEEELFAAELSAVRSQTQRERMDPFGVTQGPIQGMGLTEFDRINNAVVERIAPFLEESQYMITRDGKYILKNEAGSDIRNLVDRAARDIHTRVLQPGSNANITTALLDVMEPITRVFTEAPTLPAANIVRDYETFMSDPDTYISSIGADSPLRVDQDAPRVTDPPEVVRPEDITEAMGEIGTRSSTVFPFDIDEEMRVR